MTCSGEDMANVKLKWLCFPSLRITFTYYTEQNDMIWYVKKLQWKFISIPIALFPFPYFYSHSHSHSHDVNVNVNLYSASSQKAPLMRSDAWYSHCHSHAHGNPTGPMGSQLFPFPCTSLPLTSIHSLTLFHSFPYQADLRVSEPGAERSRQRI